MVYRSYPDMSRAMILGISDEINTLEPARLHRPNGASSFYTRPPHKIPGRASRYRPNGASSIWDVTPTTPHTQKPQSPTTPRTRYPRRICTLRMSAEHAASTAKTANGRLGPTRGVIHAISGEIPNPMYVAT